MNFLELFLIALGVAIVSSFITFIIYSVLDKAKRIKEKRLGAQLLSLDKKEFAIQLKDGWSDYAQLSEKEVVEYGKQRDEHSRALNKLRQLESKLRSGEFKEGEQLLQSSGKSKDGGELQDGYVSFIGDPPSNSNRDKQKTRNPSPETIEF